MKLQMIGLAFGLLISLGSTAQDKLSTKEIAGFMQILENHKQYNSQTMEPVPAWPDDAKIEGDLRHWEEVVFKGSQLVGVIWNSMPGTLNLQDHPFDQMVLVLQGSVTVTPDQGQSKTYSQGDVFFMREGFNGTWSMKEQYKELTFIAKDAWVAVAGE